MSNIKYTEEHEWIRLDGDIATVGITQYAQTQLGDVVYVEVPEPGKHLTARGEAAVVESVKAASEVYAPVSGTVTEGNRVLVDAPETVNNDPTDEGWFFRMTLTDVRDLDGLMDQSTYDAYVSELSD